MARGGNIRPNYVAYAAKMRRMAASGCDLEADVRFVDVMLPRRSVILDLGCGIGSAVRGLRDRGHEAYGIDPTESVLAVALDMFEPAWFRLLGVGDLTSATLGGQGLPAKCDLVLMSGNVPAFLSEKELATTFTLVSEILKPGGQFVAGTSTHSRGGPEQQESAARDSALKLTNRFSNWHLGPFSAASPWSVSVYSDGGARPDAGGPDGIFILHS